MPLIVGYAATIWGTVGIRQWIVVFCAAGQAGAVQGWSMMWAGALIVLLGVPAGLLGNELALRVGLRITAMGVFALSAVVNLLFGFSAALPYEAILVLGMAAGFIAQGNFSNLTSGVLMGVVADQMSAAGRFRRFPKHPRPDRRPTGQARARTVATQLDRYPPLPTRS
jgi:hypothetical protein